VSSDALKTVKLLGLAIDELNTQVEQEQIQRNEAKEATMLVERRVQLLMDELELARASF
jgi:hypothetical protein